MPATASPGRSRSLSVLSALLLLVALVAVSAPAASADALPPVISEIMYDPASDDDNWEWVEVHNPGTVDIDLTGWVLDDNNSVAHSAANIAAGTIVAGGSAVLFDVDDVSAANFAAAWGTGINLVPVTNWNAGGLNNGGDTVGLWSSFADYDGDNTTQANAVVSVTYPDAASGGPSVHLTDLTDQSSFIASVDGAATPVGATYLSAAAGGNVGGEAGSPGGTFVGPELFFTQYVEGSGNNKAIEIGNLGSAAVSLDGYAIEVYFNGQTTAGQTVDLTGETVAGEDVFVVYNTSADGAISAVGDLASGQITWNGNDAIVLRNPGGAVADSLGQVGNDPGSEWSGGGIGTQNETLCRNDDVTSGDTDPNDVFDPSLEWTGLVQDDFTGLGSLGPCVAAPVSQLLLTQYVEGSSNNKAIEIGNLGEGAAGLDGYSLEVYFNGNTSPGQTLDLTGQSIAGEDVFVIYNSNADSAIVAVGDLASGVATWNGNDAIVLRNPGGDVVDSLGQVGNDPGSEWSGGGVGTQNETLCRNADVTSGDTDPSDVFNPGLEWTGLVQDDFTGLGSLGPCEDPPPELFFTQYVEGSSNNKAIEIANLGPSAVSLDGYALELYSNGAPTATSTADLTGETIGGNDVFVIYNPSASSAIMAVGDLSSGTVNWNGDDAVVLRNPGGDVADSIGQVGVDPGSQWIVDGVGTQNATLCRNDDVTSGDTDPSDVFDPSVEWTALDIDDLTGLGEIGPCEDDPPPPADDVFIHEVQGSGAFTPLSGQNVRVQAIVTSTLEDDDVLDGFYLQEEDADADADPATSEGVFVFCRGNCPAGLAVGDQVTATGIATEFNDSTQIDMTSGTATIDSSGNTLPSASSVNLPAPAGTNLPATFESVEGMLVTFPDKLVVSEYFQLARFGEVVLTVDDRPSQFTDGNAPSVTGYQAFLDDLATKQIVLDDNTTNQNPSIFGPFDNEPYAYPTPGLSLTNRFRGGDSVTGLTGVFEFSFDQWRVRPVDTLSYTFTSENPAPVAPAAVGGSLKVASFNVLNYFTTLDTGSPACGPSAALDCRGANSAAELARQRDKIVAALAAIDADIVGLVEIENDAGASVADLVAALNAAVGAGTYDSVDTGFIGTDAIKVAFIYKPATVGLDGPFAVLDSTVDPTFIDTKNRPVLIQTFSETASGATLTVAVNHLKSKGSACDDVGDPGLNDGQANCNLTRTTAATALANYLATDPTGSGDPDFLIIGDLNAYAMEDPITALEGAGYTDLIETFESGAYSFVFDGQTGYLDHALANGDLLPQVTGVTTWHINADEINLFDYNDDVQDTGEASFQRESNALPIYAADPFRSSDHDPLIVGLDLTVPGPSCNGLPATIVGTDGNDNIRGTSGPDVIVALGGNDRITGLGGDDVICAGDGVDRVFGNAGNDVIFGEGGNDRLYGAGGEDESHGGDGNDIVSGGTQNDVLYGDDDNDRIYGSAGDDMMFGGLGNDIMVGSSGDDQLFGGDNDDTLNGGSGEDQLSGENGDDRLLGGTQNDVLDGGPNIDVLNGNGGIDACLNGETNNSCEI
ncbi:MAG: ExeM/NucH family extracellular endonuclease [Actinomycetota bacterium]